MTPALPPELELHIFSLAAFAHPKSVPTLALVAKRVREWTEAILYRTLFFPHHHCLPVPELPRCSGAIIEQILDLKSPALLQAWVKNIFAAGLDQDAIRKVLSVCSGVENLFIVWPYGHLSDLFGPSSACSVDVLVFALFPRPDLVMLCTPATANPHLCGVFLVPSTPLPPPRELSGPTLSPAGKPSPASFPFTGLTFTAAPPANGELAAQDSDISLPSAELQAALQYGPTTGCRRSSSGFMSFSGWRCGAWAREGRGMEPDYREWVAGLLSKAIVALFNPGDPVLFHDDVDGKRKASTQRGQGWARMAEAGQEGRGRRRRRPRRDARQLDEARAYEAQVAKNTARNLKMLEELGLLHATQGYDDPAKMKQAPPRPA
ncbi:Aminotran-1-2 domain-containing protein [Mycena chlorophos]|uniref:Aminotran-1-2 domain-containing protein n=1 Tax=Mycena chlorophos TaxID=658473 RepID=A0A8H6TL04_MYCCL|nr:Aminotran-1-2 domain-containing protein [Mycena chlorophos]